MTDWLLTASKRPMAGSFFASEKKKVLVIGGGVAGMEAARTSAVRGHQVTLVEKSDRLGGHILSAGAHSFKKESAELNAWYQRELKDMGIEVQMGKAVSAEELEDTDMAQGLRKRRIL